jgi:hypothetical protein
MLQEPSLLPSSGCDVIMDANLPLYLKTVIINTYIYSAIPFKQRRVPLRLHLTFKNVNITY